MILKTDKNASASGANTSAELYGPGNVVDALDMLDIFDLPNCPIK